MEFHRLNFTAHNRQNRECTHSKLANDKRKAYSVTEFSFYRKIKFITKFLPILTVKTIPFLPFRLSTYHRQWPRDVVVNHYNIQKCTIKRIASLKS